MYNRIEQLRTEIKTAEQNVREWQERMERDEKAM
jgi:hypothetical protein